MQIFNGNSLDFEKGMLIPINKPYDWTSFDVVNKTRYLIKKKLNIKKIKVGHTGTLDPLATGVLIVCTGKATKIINELQNDDKEYIATIEFGATTPTLDRETKPDKLYEWKHITIENIEKVLNKFEGEIEQIPPIYSAIKINGKRAYKEARKGNIPEIKARKVNIYKISIKNFTLPELNIHVHCSKGTYIRSLARDIGFEMNSGAYLKDLIRIKSGNFSLNQTLELKDFENILNLM
ncbi:MAG TPA: tRNA pseudouridine(55) synthase TruB [Bacteroidales bacterium]|jgi:tRNA pseudouridine55 synthase|nr:tRNA pseudouridine(55) synthase TruB [Bacteroidales bacterium]MDD4236458.1 tRNA pseudouridine(55) synthase TruB [Bacteroidales bacterium]MDY0160310.1 tRNA pseudouridine(55) synthase TruB [Bacteroidales bacterium]HXK81559.1 tRNA pseudouridine(55) synthase TruB [Bacteroidales bacterium]